MIIINIACIIAVLCSLLLISAGISRTTSADRFLWYIIFGVVLIAMVFMTQMKVGGLS